MATVVMAQPVNESKYYLDTQTTQSPESGKNIYIDSSSRTPPSNNISPTNYQSNVTARQLRQPRQPLYTPAALRPTDKSRPTDIPGRPRAPDTPPMSKDSSFDSSKGESTTLFEFAPGVVFADQANNELDAMRHSLSRAASDNYSEEELGDVTGPPTTAHWKPDESGSACFICNESFTWFFRRHHCRRCGNLVCVNHVKYTVPLDQNARYHPQGNVSKACKSCFDGWKIIRRLHHSRASSIAESSNSSQGTAMPIPNQARPNNDVRVGSMARSEGMVWSTF